MNDTESLFSGFLPVDYEQWKSKVIAELKGTSYSKVVWKTPEGFAMEPWYNSHTALPTPEVPFRRTTNHWRLCQQIQVGSLLDNPALLEQAITGGANAIELRFNENQESIEPERLLETLRSIDMTQIALYISGTIVEPMLLLDALATLPGFSSNSGALLFDALSAPHAELPLPTQVLSTSGFRTVAVDTVRFHEAGATITQELAITLAGLSDCLDRMTDAGVDVAVAGKAIEIVLACGSSHLIELAKLRALRAMWPQLLGAYGVCPEAMPETRLFVRASTRSFSFLDPYTNLLRLSNEALAAISGGCDTLQLPPFDPAGSVPEDFSERVARNIQLLLREESALGRVVDPAAGSYYIETMTATLCQESWKLFQQIEAEGGLSKAETSGSIATMINEANAARLKKIETRQQTLVGINRYTVPPSSETKETMLQGDATTKLNRYEQLRMRMIAHIAAGGKTPQAALWLHGDPAKSQRVAAFASELLQSGGFEAQPGLALDAKSANCTEILAGKPQLVVLCWTDEASLDTVPDVCAAIHDLDSTCVVVMAAKPPAQADRLLQAGLDCFLYTGCDAFAELLSLQHKTGVL